MEKELVNKYIGQLVKSRRKHLTWTQDKLASKLAMSRAALANIEAGRQSILVHQLYKLAQALDLSVSDLLPAPADLSVKLKTLPLPEGLSAKQKTQIAQLMSDPETELEAKGKLKHDE